MTSALVSVVLATNRVSPYLGEALGSVRAQTLRAARDGTVDPGAVELVVVDDGTPDAEAVPDALAAFADLEPVVVRQRPSGLQVARNAGIAVATGRYVTFLDDDDRWDPRRLERQVAPLEADAALVASYCRFRVVDEDGAPLAVSDAFAEGPLTAADVLDDRVSIISPVMVVRRAALDRVGTFHPATAYAEDRDLSFRLALDGAAWFVDEALVDYRRHAGSMTNRRRAQWAGTERVLRLHRDALRAAGDGELADVVERNRRRQRLALDPPRWRVALRTVAGPAVRRARAALEQARQARSTRA
ncbi:glycosyltransferase family 2 protein [Puerhibacterium puerhi]|uniref:glycosyltransferase family 2 protein n=1 Tax=Puerhibacterium puerhi TaxID=2692623 RepID=UPI00135BAE3D|nr:glycosyltransferase family 2 protein [Puerhibacterium puerhi]